MRLPARSRARMNRFVFWVRALQRADHVGRRGESVGAGAWTFALDIDEREVVPRVVVAHSLRATNRETDAATVAAIGRCCASSRLNLRVAQRWPLWRSCVTRVP